MTKRQEYAARIIFLVIVLYSAVWFVLATQMEKRLMKLVTDQENHGLVITAKRHHTSGFPFDMRVVFRDINITDKSGMTVTAPRLSIGAALGNLDHISLSSNWGMFVTMPAGKQRPALKAAMDNVQGGMHFGVSGFDQLNLTMKNVILTGYAPDTKAITCDTLSVFVDHPDGKPADPIAPTAHVVANADNVLLPAPLVPALGNAIRRISLDAVLLGELPGFDQASLMSWRDDGGTVNVQELSTEWGPLAAGLGGTLALDDSFQPLGSFSAKISGYEPAFDALEATGVAKANTVSLIKVGLSLIAKPEGDDNVPTLTTPVTIQDRELYLSSFKVLKLPEVRLY